MAEFGGFDLNAGAIAPVGSETTLVDPGVSGELPSDLVGVLVRNGPNPFAGRFVGDDMLSWWVAPAMVHGLAIADGRAHSYRNRWVRTAGFERHHDPGAAPGPDREHNPNVNVLWHAGRLLALGEGGLPFELDEQLDTVGPTTFAGQVPAGMTAHPKLDPVTGELVFFRADWQAPHLTHGVLDRSGTLSARCTIDVPAPAMMHDFAITESKSIFLDLQVGYDFSLFERGAAMPLRWVDERTSRLGVMDRHGGDVVWFEIEPCFVQHVINAYDADATTIVLDVVRYDSFLRFDFDAGAFDRNPLGTAWRYTLDLVKGSVTAAALDDRFVELPRIDERRTGRRHRFAYAVHQPSDAEMRGVVKYDLDAGRVDEHVVPPGDQNSEPVFVPRAGSITEDDGYLLTCVYRADTHTSDVVVLDATDLTAGPLATVHLPTRIPAGFHGAWLDGLPNA